MSLLEEVPEQVGEEEYGTSPLDCDIHRCQTDTASSRSTDKPLGHESTDHTMSADSFGP